ncbi:fumarylacetoacetate hydrolase family protein [Cellulomonas hominis]|uniref:Fumarylacetoacetate hydrolase family protein n=1 Tax=Cellulomonas hominis TaxID=156981 RepID=A0A7Z8NRR7_9CELL|nr:fumarylacetoacetate hydrolase family protein [Cellulomonas hominis]TKR26954.1 fumarylacetoacetate hydrolase family protein [Cellulomonas hominis]
MRLVTFTDAAGPRVGLLLGHDVLDVAAAVPSAPRGLVDLLAAPSEVHAAVRAAAAGPDPEAVLPRASVRLLAPVPRPGTILCVGYNYRGHTAQDDPEFPDVFTKPASAVVGPEDAVVLPRASTEVDYEAELAVVIGRTAHDVAPADALDHVGGYTVLNDVSARDWQRRTSQWVLGKAFDTFAPLGPAVVTPDEVPDPQDLVVSAHVNGEPTLSGSTRDQVFGVAHLVSYLSQVVTLQPGDVIATGTPQKHQHVLDRGPRWLRDGDVVEITVGGIGTLRSRVADPRTPAVQH